MLDSCEGIFVVTLASDNPVLCTENHWDCSPLAHTSLLSGSGLARREGELLSLQIESIVWKIVLYNRNIETTFYCHANKTH